ncbi:MAG: formylglycine-generating enzyme family protein [Proteobacteria bacterium]|nr:formylglycine-generating enzyme family protein [Pseudomonadota bacterium]
MPIHDVTVPTFEMTKTEITVAQYGTCVAAGSCMEPHDNDPDYSNWESVGYENHPLNTVDWNQAVAFCSWAGGRLPSEAEWEYAARNGGQDIRFPWGDEDISCDYSVVYEDGLGFGCGDRRTWEVCSKPNGNTKHGLCDMIGNLSEWVEDKWHDRYIGAPNDGSAWVSGNIEERVSRGGSWQEPPDKMCASCRKSSSPTVRAHYIGFRCAR